MRFIIRFVEMLINLVPSHTPFWRRMNTTARIIGTIFVLLFFISVLIGSWVEEKENNFGLQPMPEEVK